MNKRKLMLLSLGAKVLIAAFGIAVIGIRYYIKGKIWVDPSLTTEDITRATQEESHVDAYDAQGFTGLMKASAEGDFEKARFFVSHGADLNLQSTNIDPVFQRVEGNTALHVAVYNGDLGKALQIAELLVWNDANIRATNGLNGDTPLHFVLQIDNAFKRRDIMGLLIKHGADI